MASIIQIGKRWRAQVRRKGAKPITKTHSTKAAAEAWARAIETEIDTGRYVSRARMTLSEAIALYRVTREQAGRPIRGDSNTNYMLKHLDTGLGDKDVDALDTPALVAWAQIRRGEGAGPYTVNMEISQLGTMLRMISSLRQLRLPDIVGEARPILSHLGLIGAANERERRPSADELHRLFTYFAEHPEMGPPMEDIVRLAIVLGVRRGEIFRVTWSDLDRERRMLFMRERKHPRKKTTNHQWVPLIGEAFDIIARQPDRGDARIFPWSGATVSKYFTKACRELVIPDLHFHDCRHEAASALIEAGWDAREARVVTGHKSTKHFDRYVNLDPQRLLSKQAPRGKVSARKGLVKEASDQVDPATTVDTDD